MGEARASRRGRGRGLGTRVVRAGNRRTNNCPPPSSLLSAGKNTLYGNMRPRKYVFIKTTVANTKKLRLSASFWEAARIAGDSLRKNKLRSFLTLLRIILATTTLIAVTALIHGMNVYIAEKVSNMGAD